MDHSPENLDELIAAGVDARESLKDANWLLGDLAVLYVQMEGGQLSRAVKTYAGMIGFGQTATLQQYARVSAFYDPPVRQFDVGWTLFRTAMGTGLEAASWLEKAEVNGWSDAQLKREIKASRGDVEAEPQRCETCGQILKP